MPIEHEDEQSVTEQTAHDEFARLRDAMGADGVFTDRVIELKRAFPELRNDIAEEILDFCNETGWLSGQSRLHQTNVPAWMSKFVKILRYIKQHPNPNAIYAVLHIWDDPVLDDLNGGMSQTDFADAMYKTHKIPNPAKAAVNNAVMDAQRFFDTKPRSDQRKTDSRKSMSAARIKRLKQ